MADTNASEPIDNYNQGLTDWRGKLLTRLRKLVLESASELTEEWKWDAPV